MADKERVEPTLGDAASPAVSEKEPTVTEPTIEGMVAKANEKEAAGEKSVVLDESEGARIYREKVDAITAAALAQIEKTGQEAADLLSISQRAIKPDEATPYDTYGEPLDLDVASDMRLAQIALQDEEVSKKFLERFVERVGKQHAATITPLAMSNPSLLLTEENIKDVKAVAPEFFTEAYSAKLQGEGKGLLENAGFSKDVIERLDPSFLRYMGATQQHEAAFPVEGLGVADRLKEPSAKSMILDALANKNVQRSLKWAGLVVSCATGGIVVKAGMEGSKFLLGKLVQNENVRAFASKLEDRSIKFVSEKFNIDEKKIRQNVDQAKGVAERLSRNKWVALGTTAALVGVAFALGQIDMVHDAAQDVAGRFNELVHGPQIHDWSKLSIDSPATPVGPGVSVADTATTPAATSVAHGAGAAPTGSVASVAPTAAPVTAPANFTPPDLNNLPTAGAPAPQEFSAARSGLDTGLGQEVKFPTGPGNATIGSIEPSVPGVNGAPAITDGMPTAHGQGDALAAKASQIHTVAKGDTLSDIAESHLKAAGKPYTGAEIYKLVDQLYEANKEVIGANKDLIMPGQELSFDFAPKGLEVSAARFGDVSPAFHITNHQMITATHLNPFPDAPTVHMPVLPTVTDPHPGVVVPTVQAAEAHAPVTAPHVPVKVVTPNLALAGSDSVSPHGNVDEIMKEVYKEKGMEYEEDATPKRYKSPLEGTSLG